MRNAKVLGDWNIQMAESSDNTPPPAQSPQRFIWRYRCISPNSIKAAERPAHNSPRDPCSGSGIKYRNKNANAVLSEPVYSLCCNHIRLNGIRMAVEQENTIALIPNYLCADPN